MRSTVSFASPILNLPVNWLICPSFRLGGLAQPGNALAGPEHFSKLGHIEFIVGIVDNKTAACSKLDKGRDDAAAKLDAVAEAVADGDLIAAEPAHRLAACDHEIIITVFPKRGMN
jgi:hypothetical protein